MNTEVPTDGRETGLNTGVKAVVATFSKNYKEGRLDVKVTTELGAGAEPTDLSKFVDDAFGLGLTDDVFKLKDARSDLRYQVEDLQRQRDAIKGEIEQMHFRAEAAREWMKQRRLNDDRDLDDIPF